MTLEQLIASVVVGSIKWSYHERPRETSFAMLTTLCAVEEYAISGRNTLARKSK